MVGKSRDISKLQASLSRGGLLLSDFSAVLLTSTCSVKTKELLTAAGISNLSMIARAQASFDLQLLTLANTVAAIVDFEASSAASALCPGANKHISVRYGVHAGLDQMREEYDRIESTLTVLAAEERNRLDRKALLPSGSSLFLIYVPQLGFLLKLAIAGA